MRGQWHGLRSLARQLEVPAAYEARVLLDKKHRVRVCRTSSPFISCRPNPWVAFGWRTRKDISFNLLPVLRKKGIEFIHAAAERIEPEQNRIITTKGEVPYDCSIVAIGPKPS